MRILRSEFHLELPQLMVVVGLFVVVFSSRIIVIILTVYSITSNHNNEVVQRIISDIGTDDFSKDLIRSKFI